MFKETKPDSIVVTQPGWHLVRVDSDQARLWLKLNVNNRRVRRHLVEYLKRQIMTDEWQGNHPQPIVFSDAGRLIDGQHRLTAIAESEVFNGSSLPVRVETGASDKVREYMDTGIPRTLDDRVQLDGNPVFNKFASQLIGLEFSLRPGLTYIHKKATPDDAKEFFAIHHRAMRSVFERHHRERCVGQVAVSFAAVEYFERDEEKADEFYSDIFLPAGNVQQSQMLRDSLFRFAAKTGGSAARREVYSKSVGCMKAHLEGRKVKRVTRADSW